MRITQIDFHVTHSRVVFRAGPEGANPEQQRQRERLHRGGTGQAGVDVPGAPPRVLSRAGHQRRARGEDPQAAQHYAQKGEAWCLFFI